jgi:hypothetical protein
MQTSADTITVRVPMTFRRRGSHKLIVLPDAHSSVPQPRRGVDSALVKALARAFRWRRMLESGSVATLTEIAAKEKINASYVSRVLRLTLLAPDIVEAILDGRQTTQITLPALMKPFPIEWEQQRRLEHGFLAVRRGSNAAEGKQAEATDVQNRASNPSHDEDARHLMPSAARLNADYLDG